MSVRPADGLCVAEDWYQNDYPDEESSEHDEDGSEGSGESIRRVASVRLR